MNEEFVQLCLRNYPETILSILDAHFKHGLFPDLDVHYMDNAALKNVMKCGNYRILKAFLEYTDEKDYDRYLNIALNVCDYNHMIPIVKLLMEYGADIKNIDTFYIYRLFSAANYINHRNDFLALVEDIKKSNILLKANLDECLFEFAIGQTYDHCNLLHDYMHLISQDMLVKICSHIYLYEYKDLNYSVGFKYYLEFVDRQHYDEVLTERLKNFDRSGRRLDFENKIVEYLLSLGANPDLNSLLDNHSIRALDLLSEYMEFDEDVKLKLESLKMDIKRPPNLPASLTNLECQTQTEYWY